MLALCDTAAASQCILPVPDGDDTEPSPPTLTGTIYSGLPGQILVQAAGTNQLRRVAVLPNTELFTVYGGGFEPQELRPGQHTLIWFRDCTAPKRGTPAAAVIQICSLAPEPCPR